MSAWMQTAKGRAFDLLAPTPAMVDFDEIAIALGNICRFNGHTLGGPYSVAQHCVLGADALFAETGSARLALGFLLHDAHEAYVGDMTTPIAQAYEAIAAEHYPSITMADKADAEADRRAVARCFLLLRDKVDAAIFAAAGMSEQAPFQLAAIKTMDRRMLKAERDDLLAKPPQPWHVSIEAAPDVPSLLRPIEPWSWRKAPREWRERLNRYQPQPEETA